jgi:ribosomal protein S18 acetylase RimI-like enzyme
MSDLVIERLLHPDEQDFTDLYTLLQDFSHLKNMDDLKANLAPLLANPASALIVARIDGRIVASCVVTLLYKTSRIESHLDDVIVDPNMRGHGLGTDLCEAAINWARDAGADRMELTSRADREAANKLYRHLGFKVRETNAYTMKL